ncbi:Universal stress protein [Syntrophobacter sp. SbD1]|nr:Universal stress protein [Syntrophobacter sp. SbD1]
MKDVKRILFPVDLSEASPNLAADVLTLARKFDASVDLLFVSTPVESFASFLLPNQSLETLDDDIQNAAGKKLQEFEGHFFSECPNTRCKIRRGDPAEEILRYAGSEDIGLIVIGTHGRKGLDRAVFGSVAEKVVRGSSIPVMSINPYRKK